MNTPTAVTLIAHTPDHLRALIAGGRRYEEEFGIPVADGLGEFFAGPEVSEMFLARLRQTPVADRWRDGFGVLLLSENRLIGVCSFNGPPDPDDAVEISYGIAPGYQGRGYATEAARLIIASAWAEPQVRRIFAKTLPEENASTRVLQKCGFTKYRELIDPVDGLIWRWEIERADTGIHSPPTV
jgi:RimJ/RimL family protein N-acetyltransferase